MNLGFANNIKSAIAADITATQTTIPVMPGTGQLFAKTLEPDAALVNSSYPTTCYAKVTLTDAQETIFEICHLLSVSGDTLTVIRGQEGTTAKGWSLNDPIANFATRGSENNFVQIEDLQNGRYLSAIAGGTANGLTVDLPSTFYVNGGNTFALRAPLLIKPTANNTGPCTLMLTCSGQVVGTYPLIKGSNTALAAGDVITNLPMIVVFADNKFIILNPVTELGAVKSVNGIGPNGAGDVVLTALDLEAFPDYTKSVISTAGFDLFTLKGRDKRGLYAIDDDSVATTAGNFPLTGNYSAGHCLALPAPYGNTLIYRTWQGRTFINTVDGTGNYRQKWTEQGNANNVPINYDKSYSVSNPGSDPDFNTAPLNGRFFVYADAINGPGFRCNVVSTEILPGYASQVAYANALSQPVVMAMRIIDNGVFGPWIPVGNNPLGNSTAVGTNTVQLTAKSDCAGVIINCVFHYNGVPPTPGTFTKTATATVSVNGVSIGTATNSLVTSYGDIGFSQSFQDDGVLIHQFNNAITNGSTIDVSVPVQGYLTSADIQMTLI